MSKVNEYYRMLQEDEEFKKQEKEINSHVDSQLPENVGDLLTKEQKYTLKEYKKVLSMLIFSKRKHGTKGNA